PPTCTLFPYTTLFRSTRRVRTPPQRAQQDRGGLRDGLHARAQPEWAQHHVLLPPIQGHSCRFDPFCRRRSRLTEEREAPTPAECSTAAPSSGGTAAARQSGRKGTAGLC